MNCLFGQRDGGWTVQLCPMNVLSLYWGMTGQHFWFNASWTLLISAKKDISIYLPTTRDHFPSCQKPRITKFHRFLCSGLWLSRISKSISNAWFFFLTLRVMFWFNCSSLTCKHVSWLFHVYGEQDVLFPFACLLGILFSKETSQEILYK